MNDAVRIVAIIEREVAIIKRRIASIKGDGRGRKRPDRRETPNSRLATRFPWIHGSRHAP
jgi:hypothetical protein